jgi:hypothetical protein
LKVSSRDHCAVQHDQRAGRFSETQDRFTVVSTSFNGDRRERSSAPIVVGIASATRAEERIEAAAEPSIRLTTQRERHSS